MLFKRLRFSAKLNSKEACKLLGISKSMLYKLEEGERMPSVNLIQKISQVYSCSVNDIFQGLNIKEQNSQEQT